MLWGLLWAPQLHMKPTTQERGEGVRGQWSIFWPNIYRLNVAKFSSWGSQQTIPKLDQAIETPLI